MVVQVAATLQVHRVLPHLTLHQRLLWLIQDHHRNHALHSQKTSQLLLIIILLKAKLQKTAVGISCLMMKASPQMHLLQKERLLRIQSQKQNQRETDSILCLCTHFHFIQHFFYSLFPYITHFFFLFPYISYFSLLKSV